MIMIFIDGLDGLEFLEYLESLEFLEIKGLWELQRPFII